MCVSFPDWMSNMRIADPSINHMGDVEVLFFACTRDLLPTPACVGHIVRLHRMTVRACIPDDGSACLMICSRYSRLQMLVQVQHFRERPQLIARVGPGRVTAYCLFDGAQVLLLFPQLPVIFHP